MRDFETSKILNKNEIKSLQNDEIGGLLDEAKLQGMQDEIDEKTKRARLIRESLGEMGLALSQGKENLKKNEEINQHLEIIQKRLDNVLELSEVLRGKALVEYVAEEYINDISKLASEKLLYLLDGRYSLLFENKEFLVADNFDNGKTRSAGTLSGGETFVVSLSLALAISESILKMSNKNFDFFFLDEGFGSLDKDLRHMVLESLSKLGECGLKIGVITHIMELQNDIKNKIIVEKTTDKKDNSVSSKIYIEQGL